MTSIRVYYSRDIVHDTYALKIILFNEKLKFVRTDIIKYTTYRIQAFMPQTYIRIYIYIYLLYYDKDNFKNFKKKIYTRKKLVNNVLVGI